MGDKFKKLFLVLGVLFSLVTGGAGAFHQLEMALDTSRATAPNAFFTTGLFGLSLAGVAATALYGTFGHAVIVKVLARVGDWWRSSNIDPKKGDLLEFTLIEGLRQRRPADPTFQGLVASLGDYCKANPTAPADLAPALRAARQLASS